MYRAFWKTAVAVALAGLALSCAANSGSGGGSGDPESTIRIGLKESARSVVLASSESMRLSVDRGFVDGNEFTITASGGGLQITGAGTDTRASTVSAEARSPIRVDGSGYRGTIDVWNAGGALTVVNTVGIEQYLRGVVPREIRYLSINEIEAMKAQAIAARTYTLAHLDRRSSKGFDLYGDTRDQVYGGVAAESEVGDRAISATAGKVMTYNGRLIEAFFHSTCGGSTVNIEDVWNPSTPYPYLRRVHDSDDQGFHGRVSPHFRWTEIYGRTDLERIVSEHLSDAVPDAPSNVGRLRDVSVEVQSLSGRATITRITSDAGSWRVQKDKVRQVLRRPTSSNPPLRSSYIRVYSERTPEGYVERMAISGGGYGHGIGMCQWGAIGMARKGYTADQILKHYYTGISIVGQSSAVVSTLPQIDEEG